MKLFVGSLPFDLTEEKLKELFEKFGDITSVKLILDRDTGNSRGFGFVEFAEKDAASKAMQELNGSNINGRSIVVKQAHDKKDRPPRRQY